jgi:sialic acid synthase SpsE
LLILAGVVFESDTGMKLFKIAVGSVELIHLIVRVPASGCPMHMNGQLDEIDEYGSATTTIRKDECY